jgi:hypothetical protein
MSFPPATPEPDANGPSPEESGYWQPYAEFAKTLRTWLVSYGIGALAVLVTQADLRARLVSSGRAGAVGACFLGAVILQVVMAFVYKACMWQLYLCELNVERRHDWPHRVACAISEAFLAELFVDFASLALYAFGTVWAFQLVTGASPLPALPTAPPVGFLVPSR